MTLAISANLVPEDRVDFLDDLMTFRHFARHGYGVDYRLAEVRDKATTTERAWPDLKRQLEKALPSF